MKKNLKLISFLTTLIVFVQVNTPYIALAQQFIITPSTSLVPLAGNFSTGTRDIRPVLDVRLQNLLPNHRKLSFEDMTGLWKGSANPVQTTNYTYNNIYELVSTSGSKPTRLIMTRWQIVKLPTG